MFLLALFLKKVKPYISLNLSKRVLKIGLEKTAVVFGKKSAHYINNLLFFSFFFLCFFLNW